MFGKEKNSMDSPTVLRFRPHVASAYVQNLYDHSPHVAEMGFIEQQEFLDGHHLPFTGGLAQGLSRLGLPTLDVLYDVPQVQEAWERETGMELDRENKNLSLALAAIDRFRPAVIIEQSFGLFRPSDLEGIRRLFPFVKLICMHVGFPLVGFGVPFGKSPEYDIIFATCEGFGRDFLRVGVKQVVVVPHGFDSRIGEAVSGSKTRYPLVFSGSSGFGSGTTHWSRYEYLDALCARTPITCFLTEPPSGSSVDQTESTIKLMRQRTVDAIRRAFPKSGLGPPRRLDPSLVSRPPKGWTPPSAPLKLRYPSKVRHPVYGLEMYSVLAESAITFHKGHDVEGSCSSALRLYEATGVGSMLLTNAAKGLEELFVEGKEYVSYNGVDDCVEKALYYLDYPDQRSTIAHAGQQRTLADHTLDKRAEVVAAALMAKL